jgi:hypothetical protein
MARIDRLKPEELAPEVAQLFEAREKNGVPNRNAMFTMARVPEIVAPLYQLMDRLFRDSGKRSSIELRIRHLVMLRVVRLNECRY